MRAANCESNQMKRRIIVTDCVECASQRYPWQSRRNQLVWEAGGLASTTDIPELVLLSLGSFGKLVSATKCQFRVFLLRDQVQLLQMKTCSHENVR